ncbi:hypothetical protein BJV74DRAFT_852313 [Russula compacta]|nr:hypothetical protein BJV74DRAFT_852313 [Russula compacta]
MLQARVKKDDFSANVRTRCSDKKNTGIIGSGEGLGWRSSSTVMARGIEGELLSSNFCRFREPCSHRPQNCGFRPEPVHGSDPCVT